MRPIVKEMYDLLVQLQQSPFTRSAQKAQIEELLERATTELLEPELMDGEGDSEPKKLICNIMDLNMRADKPTANGRVYSREVLEKALQDKRADIEDGNMPIFAHSVPRDRPQSASEIFGIVKDMHLNRSCELIAEGFLVQTPKSGDLEWIKAGLEQGHLEFSVGGVGKVGDDGVVTDYEMTHVNLGPKAPAKGPRDVSCVEREIELRDFSFVKEGGEPINVPEPPAPPNAPPFEKIKG